MQRIQPLFPIPNGYVRFRTDTSDSRSLNFGWLRLISGNVPDFSRFHPRWKASFWRIAFAFGWFRLILNACGRFRTVASDFREFRPLSDDSDRCRTIPFVFERLCPLADNLTIIFIAYGSYSVDIFPVGLVFTRMRTWVSSIGLRCRMWSRALALHISWCMTIFIKYITCLEAILENPVYLR